MDPVKLLRTLGHKYNAEILSAATEPKSAQELSDEIGIPIATSYRRIDELVEADLLELKGHTLSDDGRRTRIYLRRVDEIHIDLDNGEPGIKVEGKKESSDHLTELWGELKK